MADCYYVAGYVASSCIYFALQHLLVDYVMLERVVYIVERAVYLIYQVLPGFVIPCLIQFRYLRLIIRLWLHRETLYLDTSNYFQPVRNR
jgi:hypothetical protein